MSYMLIDLKKKFFSPEKMKLYAYKVNVFIDGQR